MKATGIVRRIDDLGRIVIPKEIRRTMRIREGDPLEIYTDRNGEVIFKKYSPMGELGTFARQLCESLSKTAGVDCAICDRDSVIAVTGNAKKDVLEHSISQAMESLMEKRQQFHSTAGGNVTLTDDQRYRIAAAVPIVAEGDVSGCVAFLQTAGHTGADESEDKLLQAAASFLSKQMTM